eukprot:TRINITY_DN3096_c0_g2_i1.p2 TRINITY_DN3096_c0_g2~~TRINITY_DN3096_c0_g2_i1.p2  ORF type:complete len:144 (-),score=7.45 TRINITY_DN3096_c0_g2_i1:485-916(-)
MVFPKEGGNDAGEGSAGVPTQLVVVGGGEDTPSRAAFNAPALGMESPGKRRTGHFPSSPSPPCRGCHNWTWTDAVTGEKADPLAGGGQSEGCGWPITRAKDGDEGFGGLPWNWGPDWLGFAQSWISRPKRSITSIDFETSGEC